MEECSKPLNTEPPLRPIPSFTNSNLPSSRVIFEGAYCLKHVVALGDFAHRKGP